MEANCSPPSGPPWSDAMHKTFHCFQKQHFCASQEIRWMPSLKDTWRGEETMQFISCATSGISYTLVVLMKFPYIYLNPKLCNQVFFFQFRAFQVLVFILRMPSHPICKIRSPSPNSLTKCFFFCILGIIVDFWLQSVLSKTVNILSQVCQTQGLGQDPACGMVRSGP